MSNDGIHISEIKAKEPLCSIAPTLYNMVKGKLMARNRSKREIDGLAHVLIKIKNEIENEPEENVRMGLIKKMIEHMLLKKAFTSKIFACRMFKPSPQLTKPRCQLQEPKEDIAECV